MRRAMLGLLLLAILCATGRGQDPTPPPGAAVDSRTQALAALLVEAQDEEARSALLAREASGNMRAALNHYRRALALVGNTPYEVGILTNISSIHSEQGDYAAARVIGTAPARCASCRITSRRSAPR